MENLIKTLHNQTFDGMQIKVVATITNKPGAKGIAKSKALGIDPIIIDHTLYESRDSFDTKLVETIQGLDVDLTVMAGFMRILTPHFTQNVRAINIHPSLLPLFKGANALERSFESEMKVAGVSVHDVVTEVDGGEIIAQECLSKEGLDFANFKAKIHALEHALFPKAVVKVLQTI